MTRAKAPGLRPDGHRPTRNSDNRSVKTRKLGSSGLDVSPLMLGGNVFGWTVDEAASFPILDAYVDAGLNFIDTADIYSTWVPGHTGGESENGRSSILTGCGSGLCHNNQHDAPNNKRTKLHFQSGGFQDSLPAFMRLTLLDTIMQYYIYY